MKTFLFALAAFPLLVHAGELKVVGEKTVDGFAFPESCGYDARAKVLYVGEFGGEKLAPAEKDGKGSIAKVGLDGKILERKFLPAAGGEALNKPKGIWVEGNRLWVTDIDSIWIFDLRSKKGRKLMLPMGFANDPVVVGKTLYVTDNRNDTMVKVEPADFLSIPNDPNVTVMFRQGGINPNGVAPGKGGKLLVAGFQGPEPRGIYSVDRDGKIQPLSEPLGRLDGIHQLKDGSLLVTNWVTGSLFQWSERTGVLHLARGFKGPADFCVIPGKGSEMTVVVPDLPAGSLRFVQLK
jgi:hypothetical protein